MFFYTINSIQEERQERHRLKKMGIPAPPVEDMSRKSRFEPLEEPQFAGLRGPGITYMSIMIKPHPPSLLAHIQRPILTVLYCFSFRTVNDLTFLLNPPRCSMF